MIICLEKCIKCCAAAVREKIGKKNERINPTNTKVMKKKTERSVLGTRAEISQQPMEHHAGTDIHTAALGKSTQEETPDRNCGLWYAEKIVWQELTYEGPTLIVLV